MGNFGLKDVYTPPGTPPVAQIILVHGLFGHREKIWTYKMKKESKKVFWPGDLLPKKFKDVQISCWGYDANIDNLFTSAGNNTLHQHATDLLWDLHNARETSGSKDVPLVFIVHSLGGLIVKDALNQSRSEVGRVVKEIAPITKAICFLGTPHRGSKIASLGEMAYSARIAITKRPNLALLRALKKNSPELDRISDDFSQTMLQYQYSICSFREELETRKWVFNAFIGDGREAQGSLHANHGDMAKFTALDDNNFMKVTSRLREWLSDLRGPVIAVDEDELQGCIRSLTPPGLRFRERDVAEAYSAALEWLFDDTKTQFVQWMGSKDDSKAFWISGKPGSGKSTIMKFAKNHQNTRQLLRRTCDRWVFAGFFFHDRGDEIQKNLLGMMQALLGTLLQEYNNIWLVVKSAYYDLVKTQKTREPSWSLDLLRTTLVICIRTITQEAGVALFLDALDGNSGENPILIDFVKELQTLKLGSRLKICMASRQWPIFATAFAHNQSFEIHNHTKKDILHVIERKTFEAHAVDAERPSTQTLQLLISEVAEKASGVFIWVRIVVDEICAGLVNGTPMSALRTMVSNLPDSSKLDELYERTFTRIDSRFRTEGFHMMMVVLCTSQVLTVTEVFHCMDMVVAGEKWISVEMLTPYGTDSESMSSLRRRLESRAGGLLEMSTIVSEDRVLMTQGFTSQYNPDSTRLGVQFIHQTVREFALRSFRIDDERSDHQYHGLMIGHTTLMQYGCRLLISNLGLQIGIPYRLSMVLSIFKHAKAYEDALQLDYSGLPCDAFLATIRWRLHNGPQFVCTADETATGWDFLIAECVASGPHPIQAALTSLSQLSPFRDARERKCDSSGVRLWLHEAISSMSVLTNAQEPRYRHFFLDLEQILWTSEDGSLEVSIRAMVAGLAAAAGIRSHVETQNVLKYTDSRQARLHLSIQREIMASCMLGCHIEALGVLTDDEFISMLRLCLADEIHGHAAQTMRKLLFEPYSRWMSPERRAKTVRLLLSYEINPIEAVQLFGRATVAEGVLVIREFLSAHVRADREIFSHHVQPDGKNVMMGIDVYGNAMYGNVNPSAANSWFRHGPWTVLQIAVMRNDESILAAFEEHGYTPKIGAKAFSNDILSGVESGESTSTALFWPLMGLKMGGFAAPGIIQSPLPYPSTVDLDTKDQATKFSKGESAELTRRGYRNQSKISGSI